MGFREEEKAMSEEKTRPMKVVFLDFDGVLNSTTFHEASGKRQQPNSLPSKLSMEWWAEGVDPEAVARLNGLLKRTGAKVVVSSSWRLGTDERWLQRVLEMRGFEGEVIGKTERWVERDRSYEIQRWLATTRVEGFVILDDDGGADIAGHFVRTDFNAGLTDEDVERAVKVLGEAQGT